MDLRKLGQNLLGKVKPGAVMPEEEAALKQELLEKSPFTELLNAANQDPSFIQKWVAKSFFMKEGDVKFLGASGEFLATSFAGSIPVNPTVVLRVWVTPGNKEINGKHSGLTIGDGFAQISIKAGVNANVRTALVDGDGQPIHLPFGEAGQLTKMVGFVKESYHIKFDVERDLGGDTTVLDALEGVENGPMAGHRVDLAVIIQEKGPLKLEGKKQFSVQRTYAIAVLMIPRDHGITKIQAGMTASMTNFVERPLIPPRFAGVADAAGRKGMSEIKTNLDLMD